MRGPQDTLIDFARLNVPVLAIGGTADPYLDWPAITRGLQQMPKSVHRCMTKMAGGSHILMLEKKYYRRLHRAVVTFLAGSKSRSCPG